MFDAWIFGNMLNFSNILYQTASLLDPLTEQHFSINIIYMCGSVITFALSMYAKFNKKGKPMVSI